MPNIGLFPGGAGTGNIGLFPGGAGTGSIGLTPGGGGTSSIGLFPGGAGVGSIGLFGPASTPGLSIATQPGGITYSNSPAGSDPFGIGGGVDIGSEQTSIRYLSDNWLSSILGEDDPKTGYKQALLLVALIIGAKVLLK